MIEFVPMKAEVKTDKLWGSNDESNLDSLRRGAEVCRGSDLSGREGEILKKFVRENSHSSLLEQTNVEFVMWDIENPLSRPDEINERNVFNLRDWRSLFHRFAGGHSLSGFYVGSYRDIYELFKMVGDEVIFELPERFRYFYKMERVVIPFNHPMKRIQMEITQNVNTTRKMRTWRSSSQHSLAGASQDLSKKMQFCMVSQERFEEERNALLQVYGLYESVYHNTFERVY